MELDDERVYFTFGRSTHIGGWLINIHFKDIKVPLDSIKHEEMNNIAFPMASISLNVLEEFINKVKNRI